MRTLGNHPEEGPGGNHQEAAGRSIGAIEVTSEGDKLFNFFYKKIFKQQEKLFL